MIYGLKILQVEKRSQGRSVTGPFARIDYAELFTGEFVPKELMSPIYSTIHWGSVAKAKCLGAENCKPSPGDGCSCGIHAYTNFSQIVIPRIWIMTTPLVVCLTRHYGKVVIHEKGLRSEYAELVSILYDLRGFDIAHYINKISFVGTTIRVADIIGQNIPSLTEIIETININNDLPNYSASEIEQLLSKQV